MAGSATLDPNVLVDSLVVDVIDSLRNDLHTAFGVRPYRVFTVARTWESGYIGDGISSEVETELLPQPKVKSFMEGMLPSLGYELQPCGIDEAGFATISEISLSYTFSELTGRSVVNSVEQSMISGVEWIVRIREAHGQGQAFRDFKIEGSPFPDREKDMGWKMRLVKIEETI